MARTASIFTTNGSGVRRTGRRGFTLVELMIAAALSAIVFAAIFSAYLFMARNLTRLANFQQQQVQNRRALYVIAQDVNGAVQVNNAQPALLILTIPPPPPPPTVAATVVTYTYDPVAQTLTRQAVGPTPSTAIVLSNLTSFAFSYFDQYGASTASTINIKQIALGYTSAVGDRANGTQSSDSVASSRIVLRGKPSLGQ